MKGVVTKEKYIFDYKSTCRLILFKFDLDPKQYNLQTDGSILGLFSKKHPLPIPQSLEVRELILFLNRNSKRSETWKRENVRIGCFRLIDILHHEKFIFGDMGSREDHRKSQQFYL